MIKIVDGIGRQVSPPHLQTSEEVADWARKQDEMFVPLERTRRFFKKGNLLEKKSNEMNVGFLIGFIAGFSAAAILLLIKYAL